MRSEFVQLGAIELLVRMFTLCSDAGASTGGANDRAPFSNSNSDGPGHSRSKPRLESAGQRLLRQQLCVCVMGTIWLLLFDDSSHDRLAFNTIPIFPVD